MSGTPGSWMAVQPKKKEPKAWPWIVLSIGILLAVLIASCVRTLSEGGKQSDQAMADFHGRLDANSCSQIYAEASNDFRGGTSESDWQTLCSAIPQKMGTYLRSTRQLVNLNATTSGKFLTVTYASEFSLGKGEEKFVWKYDGSQLRLHGYSINSPRFLTK